MEFHDIIVKIASLMGGTFDDAYIVTVWFAIAYIGGFGFILSLCMDIAFYVLDILRRLLRKLSRTARRLLKVHFQKR